MKSVSDRAPYTLIPAKLTSITHTSSSGSFTIVKRALTSAVCGNKAEDEEESPPIMKWRCNGRQWRAPPCSIRFVGVFIHSKCYYRARSPVDALSAPSPQCQHSTTTDAGEDTHQIAKSPRMPIPAFCREAAFNTGIGINAVWVTPNQFMMKLAP